MEHLENGRKPPTAKLESLDNFIKKLAEKLPENSANGAPRLEVRRTSDLFDALQQALTTPPQAPIVLAVPKKLIHLEIEGAEHLPKFPGKVNKKLRKKHKSHVRCVNQEPNTLVTFEAYPSAEGSLPVKIFATGVAEKSCNPSWHSHFSVFLPSEAENLPLKIWRRINNQSDVQIGTSTVDLLNNLNEKWDIFDSQGENSGKLTVKVFSGSESMDEDLDPTLSSLIFPASEEQGSVSFSRALKRKFTELEEISQRLKARLHDVTGDANEDPDEEFERDLNTAAEEEEVPDSDNYAWLGLSEEEKRKYVHTEVTKELFVDVGGSSDAKDIALIQSALEQTALTESGSNCQLSQVYDK